MKSTNKRRRTPHFSSLQHKRKKTENDHLRQSLIIKNESGNLYPVVKIIRLSQEEIDAATTKKCVSPRSKVASSSIIPTNVVNKLSLSSDDDDDKDYDDNNNFHGSSVESSSSNPEISEEEQEFEDSDTNYDSEIERPRKPKKSNQSESRTLEKRRKYKFKLDSLKMVEKIVKKLPDWIQENLHCPICEQKVELLNDMIPHLFTHVTERDDSKKIHCPIPDCSKFYPYHTHLAVHLRTHIIEQSHKCPACPQKFFRSEAKLRIHLKEVHPMEQLYLCPICKATFLLNSTLKVHIRKFHDGEKDDVLCSKGCGRRFKPTMRLTKHEKTCPGSGTKIFQCPSCPKSYTYKPRFKEHLQSHLAEGVAKSFKCEFEGCSKIFYNSTDYKRHKRTHTGEKPYTCDQCGVAFAVRYAMRGHQANVHSGDKPKTHLSKDFQCSECGKCFVRHGRLTLHMLSHSDQKGFPCSVCQKVFKHPQSRRFHFRVEHEKSFGHSCEICGQLYPIPSQLKKHVQKSHPHEQQSRGDNPDHNLQSN